MLYTVYLTLLKQSSGGQPIFVWHYKNMNDCAVSVSVSCVLVDRASVGLVDVLNLCLF